MDFLLRVTVRRLPEFSPPNCDQGRISWSLQRPRRTSVVRGSGVMVSWRSPTNRYLSSK